MSNCLFYDKCKKAAPGCDQPLCMRQYKLTKLYHMAQLSDKQFAKTVLFAEKDGTDRAEFTKLAELETNIVDFVNNHGHNNLYLHSFNCGNGKTSWSIRLVQAYLKKIWFNSELIPRALFISVPRLLEALKANISSYNEYAEYILKYVHTADLVVWDDIAASDGSKYDINKLSGFIETRLITGKANIFTSNLDMNGITEALGERIASRICNNSINIELHGADKRRP